MVFRRLLMTTQAPYRSAWEINTTRLILGGAGVGLLGAALS